MQPRQVLQFPARGDSEQETEELVRFREAWKAELQQRRTAGSSRLELDQHGKVDNTPQGSTTRTTTSPSRSHVRQHDPQPGPSSHTIAGAPILPVPASHGTSTVSNGSLSAAVQVYRRAVQCEQQSQLDDALRLYRQAFRMDPNVDRAYHKDEMNTQLGIIAPATVPSKLSHAQGHKKAASSSAVVEELTQGVGGLTVKRAGGTGGVVTGTLVALLENFPHGLSFEPDDEKEGVPINLLPDEILILMLRMVDHATVERFAAVSRKARVVTLDPVIWREFVEMTYNPPQIPEKEALDAIVGSYLSDYRHVYIEHPRIRLDGVYIAVCHYVRPGLSENAWVNISHLITYHRYLRFFPDGNVLSLLANEELEPQHIIPLLKPTLRMKGLFIGTWHLLGTTVHIDDLQDASGKYPYPTPLHPSPQTAEPQVVPRYSFQMSLALRSRPLGRWNKLDLEHYDSVDVGSGEVVPLALKHERPFWFSKVRSWTGMF